MVERGNERIEHLNPDAREKKALLDISISGAAFVHPRELKKETKLIVKIKEHSLNAVVVYTQGRAKGTVSGSSSRMSRSQFRRT